MKMTLRRRVRQSRAGRGRARAGIEAEVGPHPSHLHSVSSSMPSEEGVAAMSCETTD